MNVSDILFHFIIVCLGVIFYGTPLLALLLLLTWLVGA